MDIANAGVSGAYYLLLNADNHVANYTHKEAHSATCTEDGNIEYWHCTVCDKYHSDDNLTVEIEKADIIIPASHTIEHIDTT